MINKGVASLLALLSNYDIIINTLPFNKETNGLLYNKNSQSKREALVVSVSRAGIIDTELYDSGFKIQFLGFALLLVLVLLLLG